MLALYLITIRITPPVLSFMRAHDFSGKNVIPFCTHDGGGFGHIETETPFKPQPNQECWNRKI
jgi:flavodoxin